MELMRKSEKGNEAAQRQLREWMETDISFGTAGLRASMDPGFSRMNKVTVQLVTQGVAEYLVQTRGQRVIVGYDHRHNSKEFAYIVRNTLALKGLKVLCFDHVVPTPLVPFAVQKEKADLGIMITASHNPATDNGYKVYGANGCQIQSPIDKEITLLFKAQDYKLWDLSNSSLTLPMAGLYITILNAYIESSKNRFERIAQAINCGPSLSVAYTPMHGVGLETVEHLLRSFGISTIFPVRSQKMPDPDFPTCKFPNPEEGLSAFKEAIAFAQEKRLKYIFATDPDADRFNFAEYNNQLGWRIFTGNEIAAIFADFLWTHRQLVYPDAKSFAMLNSCVSSKFLKSMGKIEGFKVVETLTGFKYLSNAAQSIEQEDPGCKVLMAYEEAIGFMVNSDVWDKDGIASLLLAHLILSHTVQNGMTMVQRLGQIYQKYGYFTQYNSYYLGKSVHFNRIFFTLRNKLAALSTCANAKDLTGQCKLILSNERIIYSIKDYPGTNMITMYFDEEELSWITFRTSGTEPKIKFYSEMKCNLVKHEVAEISLRLIVAQFCDILLEPDANQLIPQSQ